MCFTPVPWRNAFPTAESANKGVCVLISEKVGGFVQFKDGVAQIMASHLMTRLVEHALKAGSRVLQAPLKSTGADMQPARDFLNGRAMPREAFLYCSTNELGKTILFVALLQFFIELRRKHGQKFGIAGDKRALSVSGAEDHGVAGSSANHGTAKMLLKGFHVRTRLYEFDSQW